MSTYPIQYGAPAGRPRSALSPAYRGITIALGVIGSGAAIGYGLFMIINRIISMIKYGATIYYTYDALETAWVWVVGVMLVGVMGPTAIMAAVFAAKRMPSRPWMWKTTLAFTILFLIVDMTLSGGSLAAICGSQCTGAWVREYWQVPAGLAAGWLVFGIYFTVFFKKNIADKSAAAMTLQQQQPLMGQQYAYGAYGAYGAPGVYGVPQPQQYPVAYPGYTPQPYPYPTPFQTRGLEEDKDSIKDNTAAVPVATYGAR